MKINLFPTRVGLIAATAVLLNVASWGADITYPGYAKVENFDGVAGDPVANLLAAPKYINNQPDSVTFIDRLIWNRNPAQDNYGSRVSGWITPLETAEYVFFVAADNGISFYLSTDSTPANLKLIAADQGWQGNFTWTGPGGVLGGTAGTTSATFHRGFNPGPAVMETNGFLWVGPFENRSDEFRNSKYSNLVTEVNRWPITNSAGNAVITLTNGQRYFFHMLFKEGGGGDNSSVGWTTAANVPNVVNGDQALVVGPEVLSTVWADSISFSQSPTNVTVQEGQPVTLSATVLGVPGDSDVTQYTYQWYVNNEPIIDGLGNARTYTIATPSIADSGKVYKLTVTSAGTSPAGVLTATTPNATVTVISDTVAPTIARIRTSEDFVSAKITFSEPVRNEAVDPANYTIVQTGGPTGPAVTITDVNFAMVVDLTADVDPKNPINITNRMAVILTTSAQTEGAVYSVTINNVKDLIGNNLTPNVRSMYANVFRAGVVNHKRWVYDSGSASGLMANPLRIASPTLDTTVNTVEIANFSDNNRDYVSRISGFFIPSVAGEYHFFLAADNDGFMYLSTDADIANRKMIAADVGWQNQRIWVGPGGATGNGGTVNATFRRGDNPGPDVMATNGFNWVGPFANQSDEFLTSSRGISGAGLPGGAPVEDFLDPEPWPTRNEAGNAVITLAAGQRYAFQIWHQEFDGGRAEATFKLATEADPANGAVSRMTGNLIGAFVDPTSLLATITAQPTNVNFTVGGQIVFSVTADSFVPATYQWFKEGTALTGQTTSTLTINNATLADIGSYHVNVINENGTVSSSQAAAITAVAAPGKSYQQDGTGLTVIEAEHYYSATAGNDGKVWLPSSRRAGASGSSYITVLPDSGVNANNALTITNTVARVAYRINFNTTGTNYVWLRGGDPRADGAGDSVHVGFDGQLYPNGIQVTGAPGFNTATWNWVGAVNAANTRLLVVVDSPGIHEVNLFMREDGFLADKILLTTDIAFTPTGTGPAESAEVGGPGNPTISATRNGAGQLVITYTGTLVSSTTVNGTYTPVSGASGGTHTVTIPATGNVFYQAIPAAP